MARPNLVQTWDVETGKQMDYPADTRAGLAGHDWWGKPETRACFDHGMLWVGQGARTMNPWRDEKSHLEASFLPILQWGPGVELWVETKAKCPRGIVWRRSVVFGRSPEVTDDGWLNQPPPHEWRDLEIQPPCMKGSKFRKSVHVVTGASEKYEIDLPGDRLVVPMHSNTGRSIVLGPVQARALETPGRLLFSTTRIGKSKLDPATGKYAPGKIGGKTGFTGELWQVGWIAEPDSYGRLHGVPGLIAVTADVWVPIWIQTVEVIEPMVNRKAK